MCLNSFSSAASVVFFYNNGWAMVTSVRFNHDYFRAMVTSATSMRFNYGYFGAASMRLNYHNWFSMRFNHYNGRSMGFDDHDWLSPWLDYHNWGRPVSMDKTCHAYVNFLYPQMMVDRDTVPLLKVDTKLIPPSKMADKRRMQLMNKGVHMSLMVLGVRKWFNLPFFSFASDDHELAMTVMIALPVNLGMNRFHFSQVLRSSKLMHLSPSIIKNAFCIVIKLDVLLPSSASCWPLLKVGGVLSTATAYSHNYKSLKNLL